MDSLGKRIQQLRSGENMTQVELANRLNLTQAAISQIEKDVRRPTPVLLKRIADIFGVETGQLVENEEYEANKSLLFRNLKELDAESLKKLAQISEILKSK